MIAHVKGQLLEKKPGQVIVELGGLGLEISVPLSTYLKLPEPPAPTALLTRLIIREESWELFGFLTPLERECFAALTSVSRVGPRLALTIISAMEPGELARALMTRDLAAMAGIKGIGAKTAERLLVELKDKAPRLAALAGLPPLEAAAGAAASAPSVPPSPTSLQDDEARSALMNLGYSRAEADRALAAARKEGPDPMDIGELIRLALKSLNK